MTKNRSLSYFENAMRHLIEGKFRQGSSIVSNLPSITNKLLDEVQATDRGGFVSSNYRIEVNPQQIEGEDLALLSGELARVVQVFCQETGRKTNDQIDVTIVGNSEIPRGDFKVASTLEPIDGTTQSLPSKQKVPTNKELIDREAFLIINGSKHVPVNEPVVTIGRHLDNDIVIELKSVGRHHSQLRWRFDQFVIYDLGSRSGTSVNGHPIKECILRPGDVIEIAEAKLIYGEGEEINRTEAIYDSGYDFTRPLPDGSPE